MMKLRRDAADEAFDGLTAEEVRRIRSAAAKCVIPGLEGLAKAAGVGVSADHAGPLPAPAHNKRGRR